MIKHVLKDGTVVDDISGRIVKVQDAKALYSLIAKINGGHKRTGKNKRGEYEKNY